MIFFFFKLHWQNVLFAVSFEISIRTSNLIFLCIEDFISSFIFVLFIFDKLYYAMRISYTNFHAKLNSWSKLVIAC